MNQLIKSLPKAELHAHMNGSITKSTLKQLIADKRATDPTYTPPDLDNLFAINPQVTVRVYIRVLCIF
uniref:Adenosine deaminase n=1 Tax=Romanomermis culicivorax TaxID=13658 RepID=A0A915HFD0_ROMCU